MRRGARRATARLGVLLLVLGVFVTATERADAAVATVARFSDPQGHVDGVRDLVVGPDGNLWFSTYDGDVDRVGRVTPAGAVTTYANAGVIRLDEPLVPGPDGNMWFITNDGLGASRIGRVSTGGTITTFALAGHTLLAHHLVAGSDGNVWFSAVVDGQNRIGSVTPAGVIATFTQGGNPVYVTGGMVLGPNGDVWFPSGDEVGRVTPAGVVTTYGTAGVVEVLEVVAGPDGNVWFASRGLFDIGTSGYPDGRVGRVTPAGVITAYADPDHAQFSPEHLLVGPGGAVWFTSRTGETVVRVGWVTTSGEVHTVLPAAHDIRDPLVAGPDGNVWFTSRSNFKVAKVTPAGAVTVYPLMREPRGLTAGPDGNLWLLDGGVERITPAGVVTDWSDLSHELPSTADGTPVVDPTGFLWIGGGFGDTVARVDPGHPYAPDLYVRRAHSGRVIPSGAAYQYGGRDVYNATGAGQSRTANAQRRHQVVFDVGVQNDGTHVDAFDLHGVATGSGFTVHYAAGATDITAAVRAGHYRINGLADNGSRTITVKITVGPSAAFGARSSVVITATSVGSPSTVDTAKVGVTVVH